MGRVEGGNGGLGGWGLLLTAAIDMVADTGLGQAIHVVATGASLDLQRGVPQAAVALEASTGPPLHNAIGFQGVAAVHPDWCVGPAVVFWDAEGGHGVARHAREAVPFPIHVVVAQGRILGLIQAVLRVPPGLVQADVGGARV